MGKNKIMQLALGTTTDTEVHPNLSKVAQKIVGYCGLLFTNEKREYITKVISECEDDNYARAGFKATKTITLPVGPLEGFPPAQEPLLRSLGLPSLLKKVLLNSKVIIQCVKKVIHSLQNKQNLWLCWEKKWLNFMQT